MNREPLTTSSLTRRDWALILGLTVLARLVMVFGFLGRMPLVKDALDYHHTALAFLNGTACQTPFYLPPGTGLILSSAYRVLGDSVLTARLLLLGAAMVTVVGVVLLTQLLFSDRRVSVWAGVIAAVYPPAIMLGGQTYSQHFASCALVWGVGLWVRGSWFRVPGSGFRVPGSWFLRTILFPLAIGMVWGLGCLVRPSMLSLFPVFVGAWLLVRGSGAFLGWRLQSSAVKSGGCLRQGTAGSMMALVVGCAVVVVPVMRLNASHGAGWVLSTNNERNFFLGNNPYTPLYKTSHLAQRPLDEQPAETQAYLKSFYEQENPRQAMMAAAVEHIKNRPGLFVLRCLNRSRAFWGFDYIASREIQQWADWGGAGLCALLVFEAGGYVVLMGLVVLGILVCVPGLAGSNGGFQTRAPLLILAFVLFYQAPYCLAFSAGTYHFPAVWLLMPFAALGVVGVLQNGIVQTVKAMPVWGWIALGIFMLVQIEYAYFAATYF
jgi:hypothetical protein